MKDIIFKTLMLKGEAGSTIVSMERTGHSGTTDTYTITFDDGSTTEIQLENMSSIESITLTSQTDTEDTYTATLADGSTQSFSVQNHNADIETMSEELAAGLASIQAALNDQSALLNARMDTFTSLPSGSTAGDAELMDIRVGADGKTYGSAGSAVRTQISILKSDLDDGCVVVDGLESGSLTSNGELVASIQRLRIQPFKIKAGQELHINSNLYYGVLTWKDSVSTANNLRNDASNCPNGTDIVRFIDDGYCALTFRKSDASTVNVSDFTGSIKLYNTITKNLEEKVEGLQSGVIPIYPIAIHYNQYVLLNDGASLSYGSSTKFNVARYNIDPNTEYILKTIGRRSTNKYFVFLDENDVAVSTVTASVASDGEIIEVKATTPVNAKYVEINATNDREVAGQTVQYIGLIQIMSANNKTSLIAADQKRIIQSAIKTFDVNTVTNNYAENILPTFLHIADIHGDAERFYNAVKMAEEIGVAAIVNTGDNVAYYSTDSVDFIESCLDNVDIPMLPLIGNHDSYVLTEEQMYNKFIAPFASGLAFDSAESGQSTYYYRDFQSEKIRIIGVNQFQYRGVSNYSTERNYTQHQINFIINALMSAPDNYGIIIMLHTPERATIKSQAFAKFYQDETLYQNTGANISPIYEIVDAYIQGTVISKTFNNISGNTPSSFTASADFSQKNNSEFICYISGHMHRDAIYYVDGVTTKQLMLNAICSNAWSHRNTDGTSGSSYPYYNELTDLPRVIGDYTENALNIYAIDRTRKSVRIARIGSDMPYNLIEKRDCMVIPYAD